MKGGYKTMAISTEKLLKLSQFQTGLTAAKNHTDAKVKTVSDLVGSLPEGATASTVVGYVDEKTAGIASDASVQALTGKVNTLVGEDTNKSARAIAAEETAKIELKPLIRCFLLTSSMASRPPAEATSAMF